MSDNFEIKIGSKYLIKIADQEDTIGHFAGYAMLGSESALVFRMDGDRIRYVPAGQIILMDLLEAADKEEKKPKTAELLYG